MRWCLSEFLNLLDIRGQCWCLVDLDPDGAFRLPASDALHFYAMLDGAAALSVGDAADADGANAGGVLALESGDVAILLSGQAHAIHLRGDAVAQAIPFLVEGQDADTPPHFVIGNGSRAARLLCGQLKMRWPGGLRGDRLPRSMVIPARDNLIDMAALAGGAAGRSGGTSVLTRAAGLLLTSALRDDPACQAMFRDADFRDPIGRAIQYMDEHPFQEWTVAALAKKVGMGRSTFAARFLMEAGKAPMEVLTDIRMRLAVTLLTETRLKVAEIGERVGYRSESAFSRRFVAYHKATPGQIRHSHPPSGAQA